MVFVACHWTDVWCTPEMPHPTGTKQHLLWILAVSMWYLSGLFLSCFHLNWLKNQHGQHEIFMGMIISHHVITIKGLQPQKTELPYYWMKLDNRCMKCSKIMNSKFMKKLLVMVVLPITKMGFIKSIISLWITTWLSTSSLCD